MRYFSLDRIKSAIEHLQEYDSKWVIVPLVFAVNGVGEEEPVNLRAGDKPGTGSFLDRHFHGSLIGLEPLEGGASTMRPRFKEIWKPDDPNFVIHQRQSLWGNAYSRTGYKEMKDRGLIVGSGPSTWQMTPKFWAAWEEELPESFRFEELLVWLYAFDGLEDEIDSWEELSVDFQERHLGEDGRFPAGYEVRFRVAGDVPWPADLSSERPGNEEFQAALLPGPSHDEKWLRERFEEWRKEVEYPSAADEHDKEMGKRLAEELLSVDALTEAMTDPESFDLDLFRQLLTRNYGGPGPQSHINRFLKREGDAGVKKLAATLAYVLYDEDEEVDERLDAAVEDPDYYVSGLGEAVLTKCLAIVEPDKWLPLFTYKSAVGKGKRDILKILDADLEDGDELSMGEAAERSNDVLRKMTEPLVPGDPWGQLVFLWWLRGYGGDSSSLGTELHLDDKWIDEVNELLDDKRQVIFYGPPGTGKTYVAQRLAKQYAAGGQVEMVQFHPSYTYEDFVQGYRPVEDKSGAVTFKLRPGPLLDLAEAAKNGAGTCVLVIDEINRGNLAKIFGELYFLLEYRDRELKLQYGEEFRLPENLVIIGTMNTADRSIALVDAALRRRFHFVPFFPDRWPIEGLLRRWLKDNVPKMESVADLVDRVNAML
ncbi:MAG TPA: AAA family ATPase, partial [Solirubrobacterales bacterium]